MTSQTFATTAVASKDDLTVHPGVLARNVVAEKAALTEQMRRDGYVRVGRWRTSTFWAVGDDTTTPHSWRRTTQRKATARVVRISCVAERKR